MTDSKTKIFDEWEDVDCNDCSHYWNNTCDGVKTTQDAQKRICTAFNATRSVVMPLQIKSLQRRLKWLVGALVILGAYQVIMTIIILIYYFGIV